MPILRSSLKYISCFPYIFFQMKFSAGTEKIFTSRFFSGYRRIERSRNVLGMNGRLKVLTECFKEENSASFGVLLQARQRQ